MIRRLVGLGALLASVALGVALYALADVLGLRGGARASALVVGVVAAALATFSLSPVARTLVRLNLLLGAWLVIAPVEFDFGPWWWLSLVFGVALAVLALLPVSEADRFAGGWWTLIRSPTDRCG